MARRQGSRAGLLTTACGLVAATVFGYAITLAWDQHYDVAPDGSLHGPYSSWQVLLLAVVLCAAAAWGGRRQRALLTVFIITVVMTVLFSIDAASEPPETNDGLWPLGSALIAFGTAAGSTVVAAVAQEVVARRRRQPQVDHPGDPRA